MQPLIHEHDPPASDHQEMQRHGYPARGICPGRSLERSPFEPWVRKHSGRIPFSGAKTVIVIGFPVSLPIVDTAPSIWYRGASPRLMPSWTPAVIVSPRSLLRRATLQSGCPVTGTGLSVFLRRARLRSSRTGMRRTARPRELRSQQYASLPAIRPTGQVCLDPDCCRTPLRPGSRGTSVPARSRRCVRVCPVLAIPEGGYPQESIRQAACATRSEELHRRFLSPCGCCIKVCPGRKRPEAYGREDMRMSR